MRLHTSAGLSLCFAATIAFAQPAPVKARPGRNIMPIDRWASLNPPEETNLLKPPPQTPLILPDRTDTDTVVFGAVAEEIIIVSERQLRDFKLDRPSRDLTGPRGLDAAQPVVPWIGGACSYKTLCYDLDQPPLRAILAKLLQN